MARRYQQAEGIRDAWGRELIDPWEVTSEAEIAGERREQIQYCVSAGRSR
jgi:hypothetical protein